MCLSRKTPKPALLFQILAYTENSESGFRESIERANRPVVIVQGRACGRFTLTQFTSKPAVPPLRVTLTKRNSLRWKSLA